MVGLFVGALVFGSISDHFGRKLSFFLSFGVQVSTPTSSILVQRFLKRSFAWLMYKHGPTTELEDFLALSVVLRLEMK